MANSSSKYEKSIIDAAVQLFKKKGYENVSVNDICKAANIARSTFYLTFASKKAIIDKILSNVRLDRDDFFGDFIAAENDFERMWILCNRYLTVAIEFGPEMTATLFSIELMDGIDILDLTHQVDEWMIQLCRNAQKAGVILSTEPAEVIAPIGVSLAYYTTYEWAKHRGSFNLRRMTRSREEALLNVAPQYRLNENELKKL